MNILFLSLGRFESINQYSLYTDLLRQFAADGHNVHVLCAKERRTGSSTELVTEDSTNILKVRIGNITKTNIIEKGISTLMIEHQYIKAIKKYFSGVRFDLVLYATPPITFEKVVRYIKRRDNAKCYLLLKDIFPQNAVDIGILSKKGVKGLVYRFFRNKEKRLYSLSDRIGCMSQANCDYIIKHNPQIDKSKVEVCPNSIDIRDMSVSEEERAAIRKKYDIPADKKVFVYGGNLGKPQGINFIIECLRSQVNNPDAYFLIVGNGTEYSKLDGYFKSLNAENMKLLSKLPKEEYDRMIAACDIGLIFLDHRFTIPNFPSRLLTYMQASLPVLACTDPNTDVGKTVVDGGFGWWCESNDAKAFSSCVQHICAADYSEMIEAERKYLKDKFSVQVSYKTIKSFLTGSV